MESDGEETPCPRLSPEDHLKKYKAGSIRRVKLHNFLTYADVECFPGPRLNVVCGPNGTGKSTILCAICLGLGGQPPLLGRADDARTFIMHEKNIAIIEIELAPHPNQPVHIIRRTIDRSKGATGKRSRGIAASVYQINEEVVKLDDVKKLVSEVYHIQIENLCTFLPQDRVGSFSGFNSKQLLLETEKSVSGTKHLYEDHQRLIELEADLLSSESNLETVKEEVEQLEQDVKRLEEAKKLMEEREQSMKMQDLYKQKMLWVEFEELRTLAVQKKEQKTEIKKLLKKATAGLQPLQQEIRELEREYAGGKQRRVALNRKTESCMKIYHRCLQKIEKHQDQIDELQSELEAIESTQRRAEKEVEIRRRAVEDAKAVLKDYPSEEEIKKHVDDALVNVRIAKRKIVQNRQTFSQFKAEMVEARREYERHSNNYKRMEDDKAIRNEKILNQDQNLQRVLQWVTSNQNMFRRHVHGPIICEVTTKDKDASNYLEQHVKNTVLKSFVVECREDMNLLYREVRTKMNMRINIQMVDQGRLKPINRMYSEEKMQRLKREHDVRGYLDEFFDAPDAIMQALRNTSNVQAVLVGGERTKNDLDNGDLQDILFQREDGNGKQRFCIFAKDTQRRKMYKYTSTISRYSSNTPVSTDEVRQASMLVPGVPPAEKDRALNALQEAQATMNRLQPEIETAERNYRDAEREGQQLNEILMDKRRGKNDRSKYVETLHREKRKLATAEASARKDNGTEKVNYIKKIKHNIKAYIDEVETSSTSYKDYLVALGIKTAVAMSEDGVLEKKRIATEKLQELHSQTQSLQEEFTLKTRLFDQARNAVVAKKNEAERLAPIGTAEEPTLLKEKLDELPESKIELEDLIDEVEQKIQRIVDNPAVLRNYAEQKRKLDCQKEKLEDLKQSKTTKSDELVALKEPYEASLTNIVARVNSLFEKYMVELECAGQIAVYKGERDRNAQEQMDNFKDWGIQIKVRFRAAANLQVLSAQVHSGGERSVSTIMYLMAMQELMVSPFRCVDEINQGLDERNERLVFRRIVENSTTKPKKEDDPSSHCGQYFLITPKLLPNLTDMEQDDVTVMCIFNGTHNFDHHSDWNVEKLLNMKRKRIIEKESPSKSSRLEEKKED